MATMTFVWIVLIAGIAMMLADWLFAGVLPHARYAAHPEVWRGAAGGADPRAIAVSTAFGFLSAAVFTAACRHWGHFDFFHTFHLALIIWIIAVLPILVVNGLYIKLHPAVTFWHTMGWLAKLVIVAAVVAYFPR